MKNILTLLLGVSIFFFVMNCNNKQNIDNKKDHIHSTLHQTLNIEIHINKKDYERIGLKKIYGKNADCIYNEFRFCINLDNLDEYEEMGYSIESLKIYNVFNDLSSFACMNNIYYLKSPDNYIYDPSKKCKRDPKNNKIMFPHEMDSMIFYYDNEYLIKKYINTEKNKTKQRKIWTLGINPSFLQQISMSGATGYKIVLQFKVELTLKNKKNSKISVSTISQPIPIESKKMSIDDRENKNENIEQKIFYQKKLDDQKAHGVLTNEMENYFSSDEPKINDKIILFT